MPRPRPVEFPAPERTDCPLKHRLKKGGKNLRNEKSTAILSDGSPLKLLERGERPFKAEKAERRRSISSPTVRGNCQKVEQQGSQSPGVLQKKKGEKQERVEEIQQRGGQNESLLTKLKEKET